MKRYSEVRPGDRLLMARDTDKAKIPVVVETVSTGSNAYGDVLVTLCMTSGEVWHGWGWRWVEEEPG